MSNDYVNDDGTLLGLRWHGPTTNIEADLRAKAEAALETLTNTGSHDGGIARVEGEGLDGLRPLWAYQDAVRDPRVILALLDAHKVEIDMHYELHKGTDELVAELYEALQKYGQHLEGCRSLIAWPDREPCTCGLDAANGDA